MNPAIDLFTSAELESLVRRLDLSQLLLKRSEEQAIAGLVPVPEFKLDQAERDLLGDSDRDQWLRQKGWQHADLAMHIKRPLALKLFARQQFGPGLEELFLSSSAGRDQVIYSMLRVRDRGLARELYLRLSEGELAFPEAARHYGEGPEARGQGVIGPMRIGLLQPQELAHWLRSLQQGEISRVQQLGEWNLILRLEHLTPSKLDDETRQLLLQEQLDGFLDHVVPVLHRFEIDRCAPQALAPRAQVLIRHPGLNRRRDGPNNSNNHLLRRKDVQRANELQRILARADRQRDGPRERAAGCSKEMLHQAPRRTFVDARVRQRGPVR